MSKKPLFDFGSIDEFAPSYEYSSGRLFFGGLLSVVISFLAALILFGMMKYTWTTTNALLYFGAFVLPLISFMVFKPLIEKQLNYNKLSRKVERATSLPMKNNTHQIIDEFVMWEQGDRIRIKAPQKVHDYPALKKFYMVYRGVLDDGTLVFKTEDLKINDTIIRISPLAFQEYEYENASLSHRKEKQVEKHMISEASSSQYQEFIDTVKNELDQELNKQHQIREKVRFHGN